MRLSSSHRGVLAGLLAGALAAMSLLILSPTAQAASAAPQLHVSGNKLVDPSGSQVVLHGMDRSGAEFACVQNSGDLRTVRPTSRRSAR